MSNENVTPDPHDMAERVSLWVRMACAADACSNDELAQQQLRRAEANAASKYTSTEAARRLVEALERRAAMRRR